MTTTNSTINGLNKLLNPRKISDLTELDITKISDENVNNSYLISSTFNNSIDENYAHYENFKVRLKKIIDVIKTAATGEIGNVLSYLDAFNINIEGDLANYLSFNCNKDADCEHKRSYILTGDVVPKSTNNDFSSLFGFLDKKVDINRHILITNDTFNQFLTALTAWLNELSIQNTLKTNILNLIQNSFNNIDAAYNVPSHQILRSFKQENGKITEFTYSYILNEETGISYTAGPYINIKTNEKTGHITIGSYLKVGNEKSFTIGATSYTLDLNPSNGELQLKSNIPTAASEKYYAYNPTNYIGEFTSTPPTSQSSYYIYATTLAGICGKPLSMQNDSYIYLITSQPIDVTSIRLGAESARGPVCGGFVEHTWLTQGNVLTNHFGNYYVYRSVNCFSTPVNIQF